MAPGTCSISESRAGGCLLRAVSGSARFGSNSTHDPTPVTIPLPSRSPAGPKTGERLPAAAVPQDSFLACSFPGAISAAKACFDKPGPDQAGATLSGVGPRSHSRRARPGK
jgi:hypothetical protein